MSTLSTRQKVTLLYALSVAFMGLMLLYVLLLLFFELRPELPVIALIPLIVLQLAAGMFGKDTPRPRLSRPYRPLDLLLLAVRTLAFIAFLFFFFSLWNGGSPEQVDGAYCLMSHGEVVRYVEEAEYRFYALCERIAFPCALLAISAEGAVFTRCRYLSLRSE